MTTVTLPDEDTLQHLKRAIGTGKVHPCQAIVTVCPQRQCDAESTVRVRACCGEGMRWVFLCDPHYRTLRDRKVTCAGCGLIVEYLGVL